MSNVLSVRRVKVQTLNEAGEPEGPPTYGIMASDGYEQAYIDVFDTFAELQQAIVDAGSILACVCSADQFSDVRREDFGTDNIYAKIGYGDDGLAGLKSPDV